MSFEKIKIYHEGDKITPRQAKWIDEYLKCNNATEATINAGYKLKNPRVMGYQNSLKFKELIEKRRIELNTELKKESIATLDEIYSFWTKTFSDKETKMQDRIKASELLAKSKGAFIEKHEIKHVDTDWFIEDNNG